MTTTSHERTMCMTMVLLVYIYYVDMRKALSEDEDKLSERAGVDVDADEAQPST